MFFRTQQGDVMVRLWQRLSCGYAADTGSLADQLSTEGSGCAATAEVLWFGNSWATLPLHWGDGTRLVGCFIGLMCVFIWISLCAQICTWGTFPQSARLCVQCGSFCRPSPLHYSLVCYLQPSCHISLLPATFLVISEGAAYLCPMKPLQLKQEFYLSSCRSGEVISQNKR